MLVLDRNRKLVPRSRRCYSRRRMDRRRRENESGLRPSRKKWAVMRRLGVYLRYASVSSCLLTGVSRGQSAATATIIGKVVDPQGAVILDAKVTAVNTATGVRRSVNTTSSGDYAVPSLPPGTWKRLSLKRLRQMFPARLAMWICGGSDA
jgi:hypothetical protein